MDTDRFEGKEFNDFLHELINGNHFEAKEEGITKLVIDKGYDVLSEKQRYVFDTAINPYIVNECGRCGEDIPWCEMYISSENNLCSWCNRLGR